MAHPLPAYVIHDTGNKSREPFVEELVRRIPGLIVVQALMRKDPIEGCAMSHKYVVDIAAWRKFSSVWILEDDCVLTPSFSLDQWTDLVLNGQSAGFDIVVGGSANGQSPSSSGVKGLVEVQRWSSCHCWVVSASQYEKIANLDPRTDIDVSASMLECRKAVSVPFVARQAPSFSALQKRDVDYTQWFNESEERMMPFLAGE